MGKLSGWRGSPCSAASRVQQKWLTTEGKVGLILGELSDLHCTRHLCESWSGGIGFKEGESDLRKSVEMMGGISKSIVKEMGEDMLERRGKRFSKSDLFRRESWEMLS